MKLYAPLNYWEATPEQKRNICNGCGAKDGIKVPNTFWCLCIKEACNIHDWMYNDGKTPADKLFADAMFRLNLSVLIDAKSNVLTAMLRHSRASKYYTAVAQWGNGAFWINKQKTNSMEITYKGEFR